MTGMQKFWYYLGCIVTLGGPYFVKTAVAKALLEHDARAHIIAKG